MKPRMHRHAWQAREAVLDRALRRRTEDDGSTQPPDEVFDDVMPSTAVPQPHVAPRNRLYRLVEALRRRRALTNETLLDQLLRRRTEDDGATEPPVYRAADPNAPAVNEPSRWKHVLAGAGFGALAYGAAALGALTMRGRGASKRVWFRTLRKPAFQPPDALFGPVWTVLYGTIAYSGYRIWRATSSPERTRALALWGTQLALNAAWTPLFFGARRPNAALVEIVALDAAAGAYAVAASKVDPTAGKAVVPYLAWITFATVLNGSIVVKNR